MNDNVSISLYRLSRRSQQLAGAKTVVAATTLGENMQAARENVSIIHSFADSYHTNCEDILLA